MLLLWDRWKSVLALFITLLSTALGVGRSNGDVNVPVSTAAVSRELNGDAPLDFSNVTYLDNGYGYQLGSQHKSREKDDRVRVDIVRNEDPFVDGSEDQSLPNDCKLPVVPNGFIKGDMYYGPDSRPGAEYSCNDGYADTGNGFLRCDGYNWQPLLITLCRKMCPQLTARTFVGSMETSMTIEPVNISRPINPSHSSDLPLRFRFRCRSPEFLPKQAEAMITCGDDGNWKLVNNVGAIVEGVAVQSVDDLCVPRSNDFSPGVCGRLPPRPGLNIRYKLVKGDAETISIGDEVIVTCSDPNYVLESRPHESQAIYRCLPSGQWTREEEIASLTCVAGGCPRPISDRQLNPVFEHQGSSQFPRQIYPDDFSSVIRRGVRIFYMCLDADRYYLVGDREYFCNSNGTWSPPYWPRCERKKKCTPNDFPSDGYYDGYNGLDGFEPGHVLSFGCADGFRLEGHPDIECLENGEWNFRPPTCIRDEWSTKRFIAVSSVACLLGVLLVVVLGFFLQRQLLLRKALSAGRRHRLLDSTVSDSRLRLPSMNSSSVVGIRSHPQLLASAARTGPAAFDSDPDRLALIAFADGAQVPLPTYEEAVSQAISERRCHPPPFDAISTLSGYCSRAIRRLPSLSSLRSTRDSNNVNGLSNLTHTQASAVSGVGTGYQHSRLRTQRSSTSGSNVSSTSRGQHNRQVGSNDTMAVSDISTNITLETVSSGNPSQSASARAYAGSLSSVHSSNCGGVPATAVPVIALSVCSVSSSSVGGVSSGCSSAMSAAMTGSETEGLPLLESQELDVNHGSYETSCPDDDQRQHRVDNIEEICSQKSLDA